MSAAAIDAQDTAARCYNDDGGAVGAPECSDGGVREVDAPVEQEPSSQADRPVAGYDWLVPTVQTGCTFACQYGCGAAMIGGYKTFVECNEFCWGRCTN
jgi:hypothetical protein